MKIASTLSIFVVAMFSVASFAAENQIAGTTEGKPLPKEAFVTVNGVALHYLDWGGTGEIVILLSGLGNDAHIFDGFAQKFLDRWHVIGLTRRGFGKSSKPATGYTTAIRVEDMRQFFDALQIPRAHLVGHSVAGDEMTLFASLYPARVGKLVYLDAAYDRSGSLELGIADPTKLCTQSTPYSGGDRFSGSDDRSSSIGECAATGCAQSHGGLRQGDERVSCRFLEGAGADLGALCCQRSPSERAFHS